MDHSYRKVTKHEKGDVSWWSGDRSRKEPLLLRRQSSVAFVLIIFDFGVVFLLLPGFYAPITTALVTDSSRAASVRHHLRRRWALTYRRRLH